MLSPADRERLELLSAVLVAAERRTELVDVVGQAATADEARRRVQETFGVSEVTATHLLALEVRRFAGDAVERVRAEQLLLLQQDQA